MSTNFYGAPTWDASRFGTDAFTDGGLFPQDGTMPEWGLRGTSGAQGWDSMSPFSSNYSMQDIAPDRSGFTALVKSGERVGDKIQYKLQNGKYVPVANTGQQEMYTNPGQSNIAFGSVLAAGIGGAAMAGAGVGGASLAGGTTFAADGSLIAGGAAGGGAAGTAGGAVESLWPGAGNFGPGYTAGLEGGGLLGQGGMAAGGSSFMDQLKQGYDYYKQGNQVKNGVNTISDMMGSGSQQGGSRPGGSTMAQGLNDYGWLDSILGVGAGLYSEGQNRDAFKSLNDMYSRREQERQPYVERLNTSYSNPNQFLQGPEYTAAHGIEANRLTRLGAKGGTNANDTDRTRLLEAHALAAQEKHRQGLRDDLRTYDLAPHNPLFTAGVNRDANAGGATAGGLGRVIGGAGGLSGMVGGATGAYNQFSNWLNGGGTQSPAPIVDMNDVSTWGAGIDNMNYGTGGSFETDFPVDDIDWGSWWAG